MVVVVMTVGWEREKRKEQSMMMRVEPLTGLVIETHTSQFHSSDFNMEKYGHVRVS